MLKMCEKSDSKDVQKNSYSSPKDEDKTVYPDSKNAPMVKGCAKNVVKPHNPEDEKELKIKKCSECDYPPEDFLSCPKNPEYQPPKFEDDRYYVVFLVYEGFSVNGEYTTIMEKQHYDERGKYRVIGEGE